MKRLISYLRVSTNKQGIEGLGIDAQRAAVRAYARSVGAEIVETYQEVESGRNSARPQLAAAIAACKKQKATLCIARLDRLARSVSFISSLLDSEIRFVACDNANANTMNVQIMAVFAEDEARRISERTKAALQALKDRGEKLGNPDPNKALRLARKANSTAAKIWADKVREQAARKRAAGKTLQEIADYLSGRGWTTRFGKKWSPTAVMRLLNG